MNSNLTELVNNNIIDVCKSVYKSSKISKCNSDLDKIEFTLFNYIKTLPKKYQKVVAEIIEQYIMLDKEIEAIVNEEIYKKGIIDGVALSSNTK